MSLIKTFSNLNDEACHTIFRRCLIVVIYCPCDDYVICTKENKIYINKELKTSVPFVSLKSHRSKTLKRKASTNAQYAHAEFTKQPWRKGSYRKTSGCRRFPQCTGSSQCSATHMELACSIKNPVDVPECVTTAPKAFLAMS